MQIKEQATAKAVVKKEDNLPAGINLEELAGQGQEYVTARDQKLPILKILHLVPNLWQEPS